VLMINEDVNNSQPSAYMGGMTSNAMYNEKINFTLNGQKMLNYSGIETSNQKLAMLNDNFGTHIFPQGAQFFDLEHKDKLFKAHNVFNNATKLEANNLVGQMSYLGVNISSNIDELLLEYQRDSYVEIETTITAATAATPTVLTATAHGLAVNDVINIQGITGDGGDLLKGTQTVTVVDDANTFSVAVDTSSSTNTVGSTASVQLQKNYDKTQRSKSKCNLLFWGEVSKTMTVTNNNVSIAFN
jgi:hypothetical protein